MTRKTTYNYSQLKLKTAEPSFFNSLTGKKETFDSLLHGKVKMYHCGPTVYDYAHIGNMRPYVTADILKRLFKYSNNEVTQVINITDVGHLQSDGDEGEDKIEIGARREGKRALEITQKYADAFFDDLAALQIDTEGTIFPKASRHIAEQIALIQELDNKGYVYKTADGLYFDTSLMRDYGALGHLQGIDLLEGARIAQNTQKKSLHDFALWKFSPKPQSGAPRRQQEWTSPWGTGFPGWHIECSAMAMKYLGKSFDIHTGGIDHLPIHHNNEIAQSECATGFKLANYWLHTEFITVEGMKISKSLGNTILLRDVVEKGFSALSLRYWFLSAHYRSPVNFTWDALQGADTALKKIWRFCADRLADKRPLREDLQYLEKFLSFVSNDLDTPRALALVWKTIKDDHIEDSVKKFLLLEFDKLIGFGLSQITDRVSPRAGRLVEKDIPKEIKTLISDREKARLNKDFKKADEMRDEIARQGFQIIDSDNGPTLYKK